MKSAARYTLILALALPAIAALAQQKMDGMNGMDMLKQPTAGAQIAHQAMGTVKAVNAKAGVVTLAHGPVNTLNWPAMTMGFKLKDRMLLDKFEVGRKVEVELVQEGKDYAITSVK